MSNFEYVEFWGGKYHDIDTGDVLEDSDRIAYENEWMTKVKAQDEADSAKGYCPTHLGVTIGWLLEWTKKRNCYDMTTKMVRRNFILSATSAERCRYVELPDMKEVVGKADTFVSHCWGGKWGDLVAAISEGASLNRRVWIDIFSVRQWPGNQADLDFGAVIETCTSFGIVCTATREVRELTLYQYMTRDISILPASVRAAISFFRVWCLAELHAAIDFKTPIFMKCGNYKIEADNSLDFVEDNEMCNKLYELVDVNNAESTVPEDKAKIMNELKEVPGGIPRVNNLVRGFINGAKFNNPTVSCAVCGDKEALEQVHGNPKKYINAVASGSYLNLLEEMLVPGLNLEARNYDISSIEGKGNTVLIAAAAGGNLDCLSLLIQKGAKINASNDFGINALMAVSIGGFTDCAKRLIAEVGCDVHAQDKALRTAILFATQGGHLGCLELLIESKVDLNITSNDGRTALMLASVGGHLSCAKLLVVKGADLTTRDTEENKTALDFARDDDEAMKELLKAATSQSS